MLLRESFDFLIVQFFRFCDSMSPYLSLGVSLKPNDLQTFFIYLSKQQGPEQ